MIAAFAYLIFNTIRNRLLSQARRLKQPRYLIGLILGLLYFYSLFFRRGLRLSAGSNPFLGSTAATLAPLLIVMTVAGVWLFGGDRSALAFSEAEVSMLLTAPVSRRGLILYKLARTQLLIILNAAIWVFILRRGSMVLPAYVSAAAIWSVFTTLSLHRMGAALLRAKNVERRAATGRQNWIGLLVFAGIIGGSFIYGKSQQPRLANAPDPLSFIKTIVAILQEPTAHTILTPFRWVMAPVFARTIADWAAAMIPALAVVLVHVIWVLRSDAAFEEAAALASAEQAKRIAAMRARKSMGVTPGTNTASSTIALASTGRPAIAVVWKNMIALRRTFQPGMLVRLSVIMLLATGGISWKTGDPATTVGVMALCAALIVTLVGIVGFRNDLRSDMLQLAFLKSLPLKGSDLVLAEILSGTLTLAALQFALLIVAYFAFMLTRQPVAISLVTRTALLVASPIALIAVAGTLFTIANGAAVLFPGWLRLGPGGPGGVEMMGQSLLSSIGALITLALLLVLPGVAATVVFFMLRASAGVALAVAAITSAAMLATESYLLIVLLGGAFEKAEPQQVT